MMHAHNSGAATKRVKAPQPPLHVSFRLLCRASRIGRLMGKSGCIIQQLQQYTNTKIKVEADSGVGNWIITVVASPVVIKQIKIKGDGGQEVWLDVSAAQEGVVRVFERVVEGAGPGIGEEVTCRLLVSENQGGAVVGSGGKVVEEIRKQTGCRIAVLVMDEIQRLNYFGECSGYMIEIEGFGVAVKKAVVAITQRLQEFPPPDNTRIYPEPDFEEYPPLEC